jgi:hypothetical protein
MTEIVLGHSEKMDLKTVFTPVMLTDLYYRRIGIKNWQIKWKNGKLTTLKGKEIFGFHFMESKRNKEFAVRDFNPSIDGFYLSPKGIQ